MNTPDKKYLIRPSTWSVVVDILLLAMFVHFEIYTKGHGVAAKAAYFLAIPYFPFRAWVVASTWKKGV